MPSLQSKQLAVVTILITLNKAWSVPKPKYKAVVVRKNQTFSTCNRSRLLARVRAHISRSISSPQNLHRIPSIAPRLLTLPPSDPYLSYLVAPLLRPLSPFPPPPLLTLSPPSIPGRLSAIISTPAEIRSFLRQSSWLAHLVQFLTVRRASFRISWTY
ncbi:hypothetical protein IE53DRAFT_166869 [Violaceomyces palustris]|uniref:Uncharacterized protein n=1 Tax=Violaceomyces palustris TaxID=1673888 RepID=A0ACD0NTA5_9BASI|nr:hypothetical protein IE53DRAFT_166869 [Violaceomyces palustris]